jgi:hypothetical protein
MRKSLARFGELLYRVFSVLSILSVLHCCWLAIRGASQAEGFKSLADTMFLASFMFTGLGLTQVAWWRASRGLILSIQVGSLLAAILLIPIGVYVLLFMAQSELGFGTLSMALSSLGILKSALDYTQRS